MVSMAARGAREAYDDEAPAPTRDDDEAADEAEDEGGGAIAAACEAGFSRQKI
jgi:hypothetical protein